MLNKTQELITGRRKKKKRGFHNCGPEKRAQDSSEYKLCTLLRCRCLTDPVP